MMFPASCLNTQRMGTSVLNWM